MEARRKILDIGEWLRSIPIFKGLSVAEAAVLATFLERRTATAADVLVRQGEDGDDLFLIERGRARVEVVDVDGQRATITTLGAGDFFGEIALVAGGARAADVIALEPITLLCLSREAYTRYLLQEAQVDRELTHTALSRSRELMQQMTTRAPAGITNKPPGTEINTERQKGYVSADYLQIVASVVRHIKERSYALMRLAPGSRVLDVGCGAASDTIAMAAVVGSSGEVVGVDHDQAMVDQAQRGAAQAQVDAWVNHRRADCTALPFESGHFDACRGERVLEHVRDSDRALYEMIWITRNNGWIVVVDTDWGSCSIDSSEVDIERRLARVRAERQINNGYSGRQLYRQFKQAGLTDLEIEVSAFFATDYPFARQVLTMDATEKAALGVGVVTEDEIQRWRASLERSSDAGTFFALLTLVTVAGRKP